MERREAEPMELLALRDEVDRLRADLATHVDAGEAWMGRYAAERARADAAEARDREVEMDRGWLPPDRARALLHVVEAVRDVREWFFVRAMGEVGGPAVTMDQAARIVTALDAVLFPVAPAPARLPGDAS